MPGKQAKVVTPPMLKRMLRRVSRSSFPARDRALVLLSVKAGLRACEIAGLDWSMVLDAQGRVSGTIHVRDVIAKKRGGRRIPMHPDLRRALERLARTTEAGIGPVIRAPIAAHTSKANSIVNWFASPSSRSLGYARAARRIPDAAASSRWRPGNIHRLRLQPAPGRAVACGASVDRNHRALHRRRHLRAEALGCVRLGARP